MRLLVTGHRGYIGSILVPMLLERGHDVAGLDADLYRDCSFGADPVAVPTAEMDIRDLQPRHLEGFEAILHLAALSNDPLGDLDPELTLDINYRATVRLARLAKHAGVNRFVFSSSCSNYGSAGEDLVDENSPFRPLTPYGRSKVLAEAELLELADDSFSPVLLRSATAYGMSPRLRFDLVLNNLVAWAYTTGRVHLKSDGTAWRPIVHVEDIARAFVAVVETSDRSIHGEAFNVGVPGENFRIRELAELVCQVVPDSRIEFAPGAATDTRCYRVDCGKLPRRLPEYRPRWTALDGAIQLYEAYRRLGLRLDDFEGPRYKRVDHLRSLIETGRIDRTYRKVDGPSVSLASSP